MRQIQDGTILRNDQHYENCVCNDRGEFRDDMWGQRFDLQTLDNDLDMMEDDPDIMEDDQDMMEDDQNQLFPLNQQGYSELIKMF